MKLGVSYIAYDGMLEPLRQSQALAYLHRMAFDRPIRLVSFEKFEDWADAGTRTLVQARIPPFTATPICADLTMFAPSGPQRGAFVPDKGVARYPVVHRSLEAH